MFEKYDPGFLAGFIGVVMTVTFTFIFGQIDIIYRFSERLKMLEAGVKVSDRIVSMGTDSGVLRSELVQEASDMVKKGHNVPSFDLKRRYWKSKRMAKLILDIEKERSSLLLEIVIHQTGAARNLATDLQMGAHMDAAEEQAMAHTHAVEETAAAEEQAMAHTHAFFPKAHTHAVEETGETWLRQRVGTRKKIVLKVMIENQKIKRRAKNAIEDVEGVESVSVDMKQKMITVIGEADPVFLLAKLKKKIGFTELLSVGPAKEEKKAKGKKKMEPPTVMYMNPGSYAPYAYSVVKEEYDPKTCTIG